MLHYRIDRFALRVERETINPAEESMKGAQLV
jgi:hypothetical protein